MESINSKNIILGISGGIAAYKTPELVRRLKDRGANVRVVMTPNANEFVTALSLQAVSGMPVRTEILDTEGESGMDHIDLARWADLILIAPASASIVSRLATGSASDLLCTLCLATEAPIFLAPAMNRVMWGKPATKRNVSQLLDDGFRVLGPGVGHQACGETGSGRMLDPLDMIKLLEEQISKPPAVNKILEVMITAGPTWEALDPVRGITNASSGKMGYEIARAFQQHGCSVTLISGPCNLDTPSGVRRIDVTSAADMFNAVHTNVSKIQIFIGVAAVADYRPVNTESQKMKKNASEMTITLVRNPDILASVASLAEPPFCVGFAAETENLRNYAVSKLNKKKLDLVAANIVGQENLGFNAEDNALLLIGKDTDQQLGPASKATLSRQLCTIVLKKYEEKNST